MLVSSVALGVAGGLLFGGDWRRLGELRIRWWPVLAAAAGLRIAGIVLPLDLVAYLGGVLAVAVVALRNTALPGAPLIAIGALLNALVFTVNGGMPYDPVAAEAAMIRPLLNDRLHLEASADTRLAFLSDVIYLPIFRNVYSIGDVVIAAGGFWLPFRWLRTKTRPEKS